MTVEPTPAPLIPAAWGEIFDKISILELKRAHIVAEPAQANVQRELDALMRVLEALPLADDLTALFDRLRAANAALWDIEDAIRDQERRQDFGAEFVRLARSVYRINDERAALKKQINLRTGSALVEEKAYQAY